MSEKHNLLRSKLNDNFWAHKFAAKSTGQIWKKEMIYPLRKLRFDKNKQPFTPAC